MVKEILSVNEVIDVANLPDDVGECLSKADDTDVYDLVHRFHDVKGEVNPEKYLVEYGNTEKKIKTTLGRPVDSDVDIDEIKSLDMYHSHYSNKGLQVAGIDQKNSWNGEMAGLQYEDGRLDVIKSDYYTTATFGEIPYVEAANCVNEYADVNDIPLKELTMRDKYMKSRDDIERTRWLASGGSVGGAIIANTGSSWNLILGERSDKTRLNSGRISIVPNGGVRYDNIMENGFISDLKSHFNEELFRGQRDPQFFDRYVDPYRCSAGWNLRDHSLSVGYALVIRDKEGYEKLVADKNHNFEFEKLIEIDVNNPSQITEKLNLESASPSVLPTVYRSLSLVDKSIKDINLDYNIQSL